MKKDKIVKEDEEKRVYRYEEVLEKAVFGVLTAKVKEKNLSQEKFEEMNHNEIGDALNISLDNEFRKSVNKELKRMIKELVTEGQYDEKSTPKVKYTPMEEITKNEKLFGLA